MTSKLTKQGVRDLNSLPTKSRGIVLPEPPKHTGPCRHPVAYERKLASGKIMCTSCDTIVFDPYDDLDDLYGGY